MQVGPYYPSRFNKLKMTTSKVVVAILLCSSVLQCHESSKPSGLAQDEHSSGPLFRAGTSLVLVDVIAQDPKTGLPLNQLAKEDFRVFDNGHEVPIGTFDSGTHYNVRPIALWFIVI